MYTLINFFYVISIVVLIGIIVCLILYRKSSVQSEKLAELEEQSVAYQNRILENEKQIQMLQQSIADLKKYTSIELEMSEEQNLKEQNADDVFPHYEDFVASSILNVAINRKKQRAISKGIQVDIVFKEKYIPDFEVLDMTTLYENLLDNAIEACEKWIDNECEFGEDKVCPYIRCHSEVDLKQHFHIRVSNTKSKLSHPIDDCFVSTKADRINHGKGMGIIRSMIQKYNGIIELSDEETRFVVDIHIPFEDKRKRD